MSFRHKYSSPALQNCFARVDQMKMECCVRRSAASFLGLVILMEMKMAGLSHSSILKRAQINSKSFPFML